MISVEKPGSPEEILEHVGVKGMKWGVRKAVDKSIGTKTAGRKPSSYKKSKPSFRKKFPTGRTRAAEIVRARASVAKTEKAYKSEKNFAKKNRLHAAHLNNPDRATALRMTRGEKFIYSVFATVLSPTVVVPAAVAGYTGTRYAMRKDIERKQRS